MHFVFRRGGFHIRPHQTQSYSFHSLIKLHTRFFFESARRKEKANKKKRQKETRKGGFLKKAPFKSRKNFLATVAGMFGVCTQSNAPAVQPHRKVPF